MLDETHFFHHLANELNGLSWLNWPWPLQSIGLELSPHLYGLAVMLFAAAFLGAYVDSMAGGGGLICVPALLTTGLPGAVVLATNKYQACAAKSGMLSKLRRAGWLSSIPRGFLISSVALSGAASMLGTYVLLQSAARLDIRTILIILQAGVILLLARQWFGSKASGSRGPRADKGAQPLASNTPPRPASKRFVGSMPYRGWQSAIGFYDGFFGPGTGQYLLLLFARLGYRTEESIALAKLLNFASNIGAASVFALHLQGHVLYAGIMALGSFAGGYAGIHMVTQVSIPTLRWVIIGGSSVMLLIQCLQLL